MLTKDDDSNGGGVDQSSCCNCGCKVCGQVTTVVRRPTTVDASTITSEDVSSWSPVELFVCSELDCDFRSKSLSEVQKHKKGRHKCGKKRPSTKQQRPSRRVKHRKKSYFEEDQQDLAGTLSDAFDQYDDQLEVYAGEDVCFKDETETDGNVGEEETNTEDVLADKDTFKCDQCDFSSHSANGVITHRRVHPPGGTSTNSRECGIEGCTFQSPSSYTVQRHENEVHFAGDNFDPALDEHCRALIQPVDERRHSKKHLRYLCKVCGAIRSHRTLTEVHVSKKHLPHVNPVSCHLCTFKTGHTSRLKEHVRVEHCKNKVDKFLACDECNYIASTPRNLKYHKSKHRGLVPTKPGPEKEILCDLCGFVGKTQQTMDNHREKMHGSFSCHMCEFSTSKKMELSRHLKCAHKTLCPTCNLPLYKGETLESHECPSRLGPGHERPDELAALLANSSKTSNAKIHRQSDRSFVCVECGLQGQVLLMMQRHVNLLHGNFRCDYCDFRTVHHPTLMKHAKNFHQYQCTFCAYRADTHAELARHTCDDEDDKSEPQQRQQQLRTKVASCPYCGFIINNANSLQTHIRRVHQQVEKIPCPSCDKVYPSKKHLEVHMRTFHENIKDLHCHVCEFRTGYSSSFKRHMEHHGVEQFCCHARCGFTSRSVPELQKHQSSSHPPPEPSPKDTAMIMTNNKLHHTFLKPSQDAESKNDLVEKTEEAE